MTAYFVGILITVFITFEASYSGKSIHPVHIFASAIILGKRKSFWLYCVYPLLGMLSAERFVVQVTKKKMEHVTLQND